MNSPLVAGEGGVDGRDDGMVCFVTVMSTAPLTTIYLEGIYGKDF